MGPTLCACDPCSHQGLRLRRALGLAQCSTVTIWNLMMFEQGVHIFILFWGLQMTYSCFWLNHSFARKGEGQGETGDWEPPEGWKEEQGLSRQLELQRLSPDAPRFCREQAVAVPPAVAPYPISYPGEGVHLFLAWPSWTHSGSMLEDCVFRTRIPRLVPVKDQPFFLLKIYLVCFLCSGLPAHCRFKSTERENSMF